MIGTGFQQEMDILALYHGCGRLSRADNRAGNGVAVGRFGMPVGDGEVRPTLEMTFKTPGPVLIEAITDPYEPPMPAQATPKQALRMAEALVRGEPNAKRIGLTIVRDKIRDYSDAAYTSSPRVEATCTYCPRRLHWRADWRKTLGRSA